jgi:Ser/Thr protein kinase RdoA (MazF antagonist)
MLQLYQTPVETRAKDLFCKNCCAGTSIQLASRCVTSLQQIQEIVSQYPAKFQPMRIEPLGAAGGMSGAQFWRIESGAGDLVLRRWPSEHPSAERLRFIHDVLFHAAGRGISFLPVPIRTAARESFVFANSHLWELSPWLPGAAEYQSSPSVQKLSAAMKALAEFHIAVRDFQRIDNPQGRGSPPAISRRLSRLRELSIRGTDSLSDAINLDIWPELEPLAHRFLATTPGLLPRAIGQLEPLSNTSYPLQPCIRDIWHDHVLFNSDEVTGIIDFGAMEIDTPATDIARLLGSLVGDDEVGWRAGMLAYSEYRQLTNDEQRAAKALDTSSTILAGCNWIQWICREGRQFEDRSRVIERFRQIVARCEFAAAR